jgi:hypothetical protein
LQALACLEEDYFFGPNAQSIQSCIQKKFC